jgi:hypothetical protein
MGDEEGLRRLSCLVLAASIVSPNWLPSQCSTQAVDSHEHHLHACARHLLHACPRVCACEQYYCKRNLFSCNSARQQSPTWAARTREQKDPEAACDPQPRDFVRCVCEREREREERERERETSLQRETCPLRHRAVKIACPSCSVCASKVGNSSQGVLIQAFYVLLYALARRKLNAIKIYHGWGLTDFCLLAHVSNFCVMSGMFDSCLLTPDSYPCTRTFFR